jgi:hypothetical protein
MTDRAGKKGIELAISIDDDHVAYLRLPTHPQRTCKMSRSLRLRDVLPYEGPELVLDFDESGTLVGIEVLA